VDPAANETTASAPPKRALSELGLRFHDRHHKSLLATPSPSRGPPGKALAKNPGKSEAVTPTAPAQAEPDEAGYVAVVFRGPFHVFDERPGQTILIELEGDQVGRVRDQGKEWAWLQLDSGLMGVMRNKYLRTATPQEVRQFLDMEGLPEARQAAEDFQIGVIDLDSTGLPIQSQAGPVPASSKVGGSASRTAGQSVRDEGARTFEIAESLANL